MNLVVLRSSNQNTFVPKKRKTDPVGTSKGPQVDKLITATLGVGNLREAVRLPACEDVNEWLALHTVDFYKQISILYDTLTEFCTSTTCPVMNAGPKYEYRWADGDTVKEPKEVSAPEYVEYLRDWIEKQTENHTIFPKEHDEPFPPNFKDAVKQIFKRMFRVFAHIYHSHFSKVVILKMEAHFNICFKHFVLFVNEYKLIKKAEMEPLKGLVEKILKP